MAKTNGQYKAPVPLLRFLDTNGDGTGVTNGNGNYSVTPQTFFIAPPPGVIYVLSELEFHITASGNFKAVVYAGGSALPNGINIFAKRNGVTFVDLFDGHPLVDNSGFAHISTDFQLVEFPGGDSMIMASFNCENFGMCFQLNGDTNDTLEIILNDDFTGIIDQHFIARGNE